MEGGRKGGEEGRGGGGEERREGAREGEGQGQSPSLEPQSELAIFGWWWGGGLHMHQVAVLLHEKLFTVLEAKFHQPTSCA